MRDGLCRPGAVPVLAALIGISAFLSAACSSAPAARQETPIAVSAPKGGASTVATGGGLSAEIRLLVESGTPPSLLRALDLIRSRDLGDTEYGRAMTAAAVSLMKYVYPDIPAELPLSDPPPSHSYTRILRDVERGAYTPPLSSSKDYLEYVLPFLSLLSETRAERLIAASVDLSNARTLSSVSVLDPLFRGISAEKQGKGEEALADYREAQGRSADCYPAVLGISRVLSSQGNSDEALSLVVALLSRFPDTLSIKRELARLYYIRKDWARASPAIAEVLQRDVKNVPFIMMRAHVLVELSSWMQAQPLLDAVAATESNSRLYLLLRARIQAEGLHNRESAIGYLRSLVRLYPQDEEGQSYLARLLVDSGKKEDLDEGRAIISGLLAANPDSVLLVDLALRDAIKRADWKAAEPLAARLLTLRRSNVDLRLAYVVYGGLGKTDAAFELAQELHDKDGAGEDSSALYADALIAVGRKADALRFIEDRLKSSSPGSARSRWYYLHSRLQTDEESTMGDLRSSLFEDPRNVDALVAMLEIYRARKDDKRAVYYLKQALALAPDNPVLKKYQTDYASLLSQ